mgnify:CR=1 FL=1
MVTWYSKRGYDTGKAKDAMGYMVLKADGSDYDGADAPFWNMNYSSAFLVEEAQVALNTLTPESVDPAEPEWWDAMEDIDLLELRRRYPTLRFSKPFVLTGIQHDKVMSLEKLNERAKKLYDPENGGNLGKTFVLVTSDPTFDDN